MREKGENTENMMTEYFLFLSREDAFISVEKKTHIHPCWNGKADRKKGKAIKDLQQYCSDIFYLFPLLYTVHCQRPEGKKAGEGPYVVMAGDGLCCALSRGWADRITRCRSALTSPMGSLHKGTSNSPCSACRGKPHCNYLCGMLLSPRKSLSPTSSFPPLCCPLVPTSLCLLPLSAADWGSDLC